MDGLGAYLHASGDKPLLSPTSERRLARRARAGSKRAKDELVERNLRLVIPTAKKFRGQGLSFEDLIGEGNAGLIKAADKFAPEMGYRFSTYATWWIHQSVSRALAHTGATIRIPVHVGEHRHRIYKAVRDFEGEHAREPSMDELEGLTGLESEVIRWAQSVPERQASIEAPIRGDEPDGSTMGSVIPDTDQGEEVAGEAPLLLGRVDVARGLRILSQRERWIIERRYGLDGGAPATLREMGEQMGIAYQHVGAINRRALKRLGARLRDAEPEDPELHKAS